MATFVLIHGAWHGGWCWDKVAPLLRAAGHTVVTPDLPGHGDDSTPVAQVSMQAYADRVCAVLAAQPEPAILVGHSMGGLVISAAAEQCPERMRRLVFLTAIIPPLGAPAISGPDAGSVLGQYLRRNEAEGTLTVADEGIKPSFYHDCSDEDVDFAKARLVPQAAAALGARPAISQERFGTVPRAYIECVDDKAISVERQRQIHSAAGCEPVLSLNTSHSPFFSAPEALAEQLLSLA